MQLIISHNNNNNIIIIIHTKYTNNNTRGRHFYHHTPPSCASTHASTATSPLSLKVPKGVASCFWGCHGGISWHPPILLAVQLPLPGLPPPTPAAKAAWGAGLLTSPPSSWPAAPSSGAPATLSPATKVRWGSWSLDLSPLSSCLQLPSWSSGHCVATPGEAGLSLTPGDAAPDLATAAAATLGRRRQQQRTLGRRRQQQRTLGRRRQQQRPSGGDAAAADPRRRRQQQRTLGRRRQQQRTLGATAAAADPRRRRQQQRTLGRRTREGSPWPWRRQRELHFSLVPCVLWGTKDSHWRCGRGRPPPLQAAKAAGLPPLQRQGGRLPPLQAPRRRLPPLQAAKRRLPPLQLPS